RRRRARLRVCCRADLAWSYSSAEILFSARSVSSWNNSSFSASSSKAERSAGAFIGTPAGEENPRPEDAPAVPDEEEDETEPLPANSPPFAKGGRKGGPPTAAGRRLVIQKAPA